MEIKASLILLIVLIFDFLSTSRCEILVTTYQNLDLMKSELQFELNKIFSGLNLTDKFSNLTLTDRWYLLPETLNITDFKISSYKYNVNALSNLTLQDQSSLLAVGNMLNLTYVFDYNYFCYPNFKDKGWGTIMFRLEPFQFFKSYNFSQEAKLKKATASFSLVIDNIYLSAKYSKSKEVLRIANNGFTQAVSNEIQEKIIKKINSEIQKYYLNLNEKEEIKVTSNDPKKDFVYSLLEEIPAFNMQKGTINYYNSDLSNANNIEKIIEQHQLADVWDKFNENDGSYQMFIHYNNLLNILNSITSQNQFTFNINNGNLAKQLDFEMDVQDLGRFYPGIY